jgi:hypothetical protein
MVEKDMVFERRVLAQVVRVLQTAVDGVAYGGVKFSVEAALHALPYAVAGERKSRAHVAVLCELGIVELLVTLVKQYSASLVANAADAREDGGGSGREKEGRRSEHEHLLRVLALCVLVMRRMCLSEAHCSASEAVCIQRLNILGAQPVITALVQHLSQLSHVTPQAPALSTTGTGAATAEPGLLSLQHMSAASHPSAPAAMSKTQVLEDARAVVEVLSHGLADTALSP